MMTITIDNRLIPTTVDSLLHSLGMTLPQKLSPDINGLLNLDLNSIEGLTLKDWPKLLYYTFLFIFQHAQIDPNIATYSYVTAKDFYEFNELSTLHSNIIEDYLAMDPEYRILLYSSFTELDLQKYFNSSTFDNPRKIALLCFSNVPLLKKIFITSWNNQNIKINETVNYPLTPNTNNFILGHTFHMKKGIHGKVLELISMHESDFLIVEKMLNVSRNRAQHILNHCQRLKEDTEVIKKSYAKLYNEPLLSNNILFFLQANSLPSHQNIMLKTLDITIEELRLQINDPELRKLLSGKRIASFTLAQIIDYRGIVELIQNYGINSKILSLPPHKVLNDFLSLTKNSETYEVIIQQLINSKLIINLDDVNHVDEQILCLEQSIHQLDLTLKMDKPSNKNTLSYAFYLAEKKIYELLLIQLKSVQLNKRMEEYMAADQSEIREESSSSITTEFSLC